MVLEQIISCLQAQTSGKSYKAECPAHNDVNPSLSITQSEDGKLLFRCFAGCPQEDIVEALQEQGLWSKKPAQSSKIVRTYDYVDERGHLLFQQVRLDPKAFRPRRPDPANPGRYIWSVKNADGTYAVRLVPYRLPEVIASHTVYVVEGEKDADTLHSHGFCGTTNAFGAGNWRDEFNPYFKGKRVFVIPDNDKAGWSRVVRIASGVALFASELSILYLDPEVKDITEWFGQGHSASELSDIVGRRCGNE